MDFVYDAKKWVYLRGGGFKIKKSANFFFGGGGKLGE